MDSSIQSMGDIAVTNAFAGKTIANGNVDKAAKDFEAMFISQMMQPMFDSVSVDPTFGGGHGEEIMRTFLVQEYGKIAANSGHLGIASMVKKEMIRSQEARHPANNGGPSAAAQ